MSMRRVFRVRIRVLVLGLILAGSGIVIFLQTDYGDKVVAAETDSAPNQCDQNYTFCRAKCEKDDKCLTDCRTAYDACRRRGISDR
jgi:hypothetical protein